MDTKRYLIRTEAMEDVLQSQGRRARWLASTCKISYRLFRYQIKRERTVSESVAKAMALALGVPFYLLFDCTDVQETDALEALAS